MSDLYPELCIYETEISTKICQLKLDDALFTDGIWQLYADGKLDERVADYPQLDDIIHDMPDVHNIQIRKIAGKTDEPSSRVENASDRLRCIYPLKIPAAKRSGIWVDGETKFFNDGSWIIYDHTRPHSIFNKHKRSEAVILIMEIQRPPWITKGIL